MVPAPPKITIRMLLAPSLTGSSAVTDQLSEGGLGTHPLRAAHQSSCITLYALRFTFCVLKLESHTPMSSATHPIPSSSSLARVGVPVGTSQPASAWSRS